MCYEYSNSFLLAILKSIIVGYTYNTMLQNMRNYYTYPTASYACYLLLLHLFSPILSLDSGSIILFFILRLVCSFQTHFCVSVASLLNIMSYNSSVQIIANDRISFLLLLKNILFCIGFIYSSNIDRFHISGIVNNVAMETQVSFGHTNLAVLWLCTQWWDCQLILQFCS